MLPEELKRCSSLAQFKDSIKSWTPDNCPCELCKVFVQGLGYVNVSKWIILPWISSIDLFSVVMRFLLCSVWWFCSFSYNDVVKFVTFCANEFGYNGFGVFSTWVSLCPFRMLAIIKTHGKQVNTTTHISFLKVPLLSAWQIYRQQMIPFPQNFSSMNSFKQAF